MFHYFVSAIRLERGCFLPLYDHETSSIAVTIYKGGREGVLEVLQLVCWRRNKSFDYFSVVVKGVRCVICGGIDDCAYMLQFITSGDEG